MCHRGFDAVDALHQHIFKRSGGHIQHRPQRHTGQLLTYPFADVAQYRKGRLVRKRGGNAVKAASPHPKKRHHKAVL